MGLGLTRFLCSRCKQNRTKFKNVAIEAKLRTLTAELQKQEGHEEARFFLEEDGRENARNDLQTNVCLGIACFVNSMLGGCDPQTGEPCEVSDRTYEMLNGKADEKA